MILWVPIYNKACYFPFLLDVVIHPTSTWCEFYERGKRKAKMFLDILSDFGILWATKERRESSIMGTICIKNSQFLKISQECY
jgi:hypothetical protein